MSVWPYRNCLMYLANSTLRLLKLSVLTIMLSGGLGSHFEAYADQSTGNASVTIELRITSGFDDVEQSATGKMYINSSDLELVDDPGGNGLGQIVGLRFTGVEVPQGAVITGAFLRFSNESKRTKIDPTKLRFQGIDSANPPTFSTNFHDVSNRPTTATSIDWTPDPWDGRNKPYDSPDLSEIVQEIASKPGWASGNAIGFVITGTGERSAWSYEGNAAGAVQLVISFQSTGDDLVAARGNNCPFAEDSEDAFICRFIDLKLANHQISQIYVQAQNDLRDNVWNKLLAEKEGWQATRRLCGQDYVCVRQVHQDWHAGLKVRLEGGLASASAGSARITTGTNCSQQTSGMGSAACSLNDLITQDRKIAKILNEIANDLEGTEIAQLQRTQNDWVARIKVDCRGAIRCIRTAFKERIVALEVRQAQGKEPESGDIDIIGTWKGTLGCGQQRFDLVIDVQGIEPRNLRVRLMEFASPRESNIPDRDYVVDGWYDGGQRNFAFDRYDGVIAADGAELSIRIPACYSERFRFAAAELPSVDTSMQAAIDEEEKLRALEEEEEKRAKINAEREVLEAELAARDDRNANQISNVYLTRVPDFTGFEFSSNIPAERVAARYQAAGYAVDLIKSNLTHTCSGAIFGENGQAVIHQQEQLTTSFRRDTPARESMPTCKASYTFGVLALLECKADFPFSWPFAKRLFPTIAANLGEPDQAAANPDFAFANDYEWSCGESGNDEACQVNLTEYGDYGRYELVFQAGADSVYQAARARIDKYCGGQ